MAAKIKGLGRVVARLENLASETNRTATRELEKGAHATAKLVKAQAPVKTGALEDSIEVIKIARGGINGRNAWLVRSNPNKWRSNGSKRQRVGRYNWRMESGTYNLGIKSREKDLRVRAQNPRWRVGAGYLSRSINYMEPVIRKRIMLALQKVTK